MTRILFLAIAMTLTLLGARAQDAAAERYFPYPEVPDDITVFQERADFLLNHFWDRCNMHSAFKSKPRMAEAFADYVAFIPHGSATAALGSIDRLLKSLEKQPEDLVFIAEQAERCLYSDSAEFVSDEAFLPFAKAVAANKKVDKASKLRFQRKAKIVESNMTGAVVPDVKFTRPDGSQGSLAADTAKMTIVYINDPDCDDCRLARTRLDASITLADLVKSGALRFVALTPDEPTAEWTEKAKSYPEGWTVGAAPDAYDELDIRYIPSFYILDRNNKIMQKNVDIDALMRMLSYF